MRLLSKYNIGFDFQFPVGSYLADFHLCDTNVVIEVDGYHHFTEAGKVKDAIRNGFFLKSGFVVLRIANSLVEKEDCVLWGNAESLISNHPEVIICRR